MRPKIKGDTFYIPVSEGIYFRHNQGSFLLKGKVVYQWFERLAPYLDGHYTLEEITHGLPAEKQTMVNDLVHILVSKGILKDITPDLSHTLSETEQRLYASEIAFIDAFTGSAMHRFEQFRNSRVLLIGSGITFTALVHSLLRSGLRQIALIVTSECATDQQRHADYLELYNSRGANQALLHLPSPAWQNESEVATALTPFDVVLSISDLPMLARATILNRLCLAQQKTFLQAVLIDDHAWIGPLVGTTRVGCWECAWRRLWANLPALAQPHHAIQDYTTAPRSSFLALPTAALAANQLGFEIFKLLTGIGQLETEHHLLALDLETVQTRRHPFAPHPCCQSCQSPPEATADFFQEVVQGAEQGEPLEPETFSRRIAPCFEPRLGLFCSLDEHDFTQLPLHVAQVGISSPLFERHADSQAVTGVGLDFSAARQRAAQRACEIYAASLVDPRRLPRLTSQHRAHYAIQADWLLPVDLPNACQEWTWTQELQTKHLSLLPAALVYPPLRGLTPSEETAPGLASGLSWAEAICRAIIGYCRYWAMTHLEELHEPVPQVNLVALPPESDSARYHGMLNLLGATVTVYDLSALLHLPTFAFCREDKTIAYSTHIHSYEALQAGLEQVVQYTQAAMYSQPQYAPPAVPNLPRALRSAQRVLPANDASLDWPARQHCLQQLLHERNWRAFVAPLQLDPALTTALPYIVHVLMARSE